MKTEELLNNSLRKIQETTVHEEVYETIRQVTDALARKQFDFTGDDISRAIAKLSVLRVNLGEAMVDAIAKYDFSYLNRKIQYANEWQTQKVELNKKIDKLTNPDVEAEVQEQIKELLIEEIENKHYGERLRILYDSTSLMISALQSRLNVIKQEKVETSYYNK